MTTERPPNYYAILGIQDTATEQQVRDAYKRAALKTHPDRVAADSPERPARTRKFQLVNDAYYTLSDARRRSSADPFGEADGEAEGGGQEEPHKAGSAGQSAYSWAWNFFTKKAGAGGDGGGGGGGGDGADRQQTENAQFGDVFEEMMREQGMAEDGTNRPTKKFWSLLGGVSGGALGFIVANVPGMVAGAVAGNRLGAVRDAKGKSVFAVFQELPQDDRARLLSQLAARVFSHAVGV
ncbi:dnaJ domain-containing protein [Hirsutella rhossiliensis]|uniref:DnaJ domain-containing protein n=1 Tax=Hirsutella rhossiliensis TaxID=111463 RepID=A0A9P8N5N9_9HYPO|nr:dnaJ domain-containing protein [Hirsutella rhossiliensis]KAH0967315.1 dnaJ domain-containing protein [Hirsutella rhossiliensis]